MDNKYQQFIEAYNNANLELKEFIDSEAIGLFIESKIQGTTYATLKRKLIVLTANKIFNLISDDELSTSLIKIGIQGEDSRTMYNEIKSFVEKVISEIDSSNIFEESIIETKPETPPNTINNIRTMASDGKQVGYENSGDTIYSSSQSAILEEGK